jgi:hypothetical protein
MPARNRNPIQISRVSVACLALLVAVCGGYFALVPFLRAIEPSPSIGEAATVKSPPKYVAIANTVNPDLKPNLVTNQLRPKKHKTVKPKKPVHKTKRTTTVPTRPVLVTNQVRSGSSHASATPTHTSTTPTRTHSTPTHTTPKHSTPTHTTPKKPAAPPAPSRDRGPIVGDTNQQGSGLAGHGNTSSGARVTGGVASTPGH